ncbi:MAG: carbohydrate ABC transporter permease, partial [Solirubrobacterales bacterium]|nr:carbohydrate ABC transporter permease [Solirubrobacterales bacterium]
MRPSRLATAARVVVVVLLVAWSLGPIVVGVLTSLSTQPEIAALPAHWLPADPSLDAYSSLLGSDGGGDKARVGVGTASDASAFKSALLNTTILTVVSTLVILVVAILAGYGFSRLAFKGSSVLMWVVVATLIIPLFTL